MTTFGSGASSSAQYHKHCPAGAYYDVAKQWCYKCPAGTWWPHGNLETDTCLPCSGSTRVGATSCKAYTGYGGLGGYRNHTKTAQPKPVPGQPKPTLV